MIVVGCGKAKSSESAPAREFYTGNLFRASRRYADESRKPWLILSAVHGIIEPSDVLGPHDQRQPARKAERRRWARLCADAIEKRLSLGESVELLMSAEYADAIARELGARGVRTTQPLRGLDLGFRLQVLGQMADDLQSRRVSPAAEGTEGNGSR